MSITWQNPPPKVHSLVAWADEVVELRANPGRWARLCEKPTRHGATSMVHAVNTGQMKAFRPAGDFEACARQAVVYVRFLGDGELPSVNDSEKNGAPQ